MKALVILFTGTILSFSSNAQNMAHVSSGNYGGDGNNAPCLQLHENHTFVYTDLTKNPSRSLRKEPGQSKTMNWFWNQTPKRI
jgi:hypothetical protein